MNLFQILSEICPHWKRFGRIRFLTVICVGKVRVMASSRKGSSVKSVSSASPTIAFRSSDVSPEINRYKAENAGTRENDRKSPAGNNSVAMSRNTNASQIHRGGSLSRPDHNGVLLSNRKSKSLDDIDMSVRNKNMQVRRGRSSPNFLAKKSVLSRSDAKSTAYRPMENSPSPKNKTSKRPPLVKNPSAGTILSKTDQRVKQLNSKLKCSHDPISSIDSVDIDSDLVTDRGYEQALLELNLLPEGLSPEKGIITKWVVAPEKSETPPTFKGFQTFDGSKFSPIEEASLVLNESNAELCANVVEKEAETMYEHIDLFERLPIKSTLQGEVTKEHEILGEYVTMDSIFPLQFSPRQYNYPANVYQDPFQTKIWQATSEESVSDEKCFTCTSEESTSDGKWSTYSSSESSSALQNELSSYLGEKHYSLQHRDCDSITSSEKHYSLQHQDCASISSSEKHYSLRHQDCDSISSSEKHYSLRHQDCDSISSSILTLDLEELDLGNSSNGMSSDSVESEANKIAHQLVASAACGFEGFTSDVSLMHYNPSTPVGKLPLKHLDYKEETSLNFSLEDSIIQMGAEFGYLNSNASKDIVDNSNQEPLFWPLNPDSYWHDNNDIKSLQSVTDSECQLKAERTSVSSGNTRSSLSSDNSEWQGGMQSLSGRKAASSGDGSIPSCRVRDFVHPSSEGITSKPAFQLLNDISRMEFGYQNQSCSQSKVESDGQSMGEINDSNREFSTLPRVNGISTEAQAHSQSVGGSKKVSKVDSSSLSSHIKGSNIGKAKHAIPPALSKLSLDNSAKWPDENKSNRFKTIDIKCTQGERTSSPAALIEGSLKGSEEMKDDYLTPCRECVNPGNDRWKLTTGEPFYSIPKLLTGCFESGEESIEMLVGMKEFDGQEGIGALTSEMVPFPYESGQRETFCSNVDCAIQHGKVQSVSTTSNAEGQDESTDLSFIENTVVLDKDTGLCLSLASEIDTAIVPPEGATKFNFGNSATLQQLKGNQVPRLKDYCFQDYGQPNGNNGVDSIWNDGLLTCIDFGWRSDSKPSALNLDKITINSMEDESLPRRFCLQKCAENIKGNYAEQNLIYLEPVSPCEKTVKEREIFPLLPPSQIARNNRSLASLKESPFARSRDDIKYQNSGIGCSKVNSNNGRDKISLSEWEIKDNKSNVVCKSELTTGSFGHQKSGEDKSNVVCKSELTTGSFGHQKSGEEHLSCADISAKDYTASSETSFMNAVHNWTQTGQEEFSDAFQGSLFNNPIIKSYCSGILHVNCVKLLEENLHGMLQPLRINADNLMQALLCFLFNNPKTKSCFSGILDGNCIKLLEENLQGMLQYMRTNADNLFQASLWYEDLQKNTEDHAILDLQSIKYEDCNFIDGERFENMEKPLCFSRKERSKEDIFSGIYKVRNKNESLQENSGHMLKVKTEGPETEEIRVVNHIHYDDSTVAAERPMSATFLPEANDLLSTLLYFVLILGKNSIAHDCKSHNANRLADLEMIGMDRKVQALEAELMEIKQQNKKLGSLMKSMLTITQRLQQSSREKKWHRRSRRPLVCKFVLHPRKKRVHRCEN